MVSAMRELKSFHLLSLDWNIKQTGKKPKQYPPSVTYRLYEGLNQNEFKGNLVIYDNDGTAWETKFDNQEAMSLGLEDFKKVCSYYSRENKK